MRTLPRSLKKGCAARIAKADVRTPALFDVLAREGNVPERDMFNTFNMGVGMTLVVAAEDADKALAILHDQARMPTAWASLLRATGWNCYETGSGTGIRRRHTICRRCWKANAAAKTRTARSCWWSPASPASYALERAANFGVESAVVARRGLRRQRGV